ncbi:hypothetical protein KC363_g5594 [Hortaea werneckii]|uniref:Nitrate reductase [NADPH] n=1 Tax=Hortaea werneckii TaxID=91943 RepID=A0A3M7FER4_HORWE|nr:hypothetical protein KC361_g5975 [Hortaea werneckii]KAI6882187.1 hypothetical protein KC325_g5967 [Hortaea werneckii]KAI6990824.1 hypothetical protein KC359_g6488 [Hortaea werneckii]KAI7143902.1 hypothetical protein KC344_g5858 [Hortaea werneckii]KAI7171704.1 hypothetical protein KC360_g5989 [Hortaea werneckii]
MATSSLQRWAGLLAKRAEVVTYVASPRSQHVGPKAWRSSCRTISRSRRGSSQQRRLSSNARTGIDPECASSSTNIATAIAGGALAFAGAIFVTTNTSFAEQPGSDNKYIRLEEIHEHNRKADTYWVYRGDRVYDITDWIPNHPGGEVIMRAVGGSIEPYWNIFTIHQKQDVYDVLEQYFIGLIDPRDLVNGRAPADQIDDPFKSDPTRDEELIVHSARPFNAETPVSDLQTFITDNARFYKRHHLWVPQLDEKTFKLTVELPNGEEKQYSVEDLRSKFQSHTITATMQCSGNRRSHMTEGSSPTNGIQWGVGAISNAEWTGVKIMDVLQDAGLDVADLGVDVKHVQFVGAEAYGASIPVEKVADRFGDAMIVYAMNGKPLPRDHGYPLRALVPGTVAARSVKWVNKIVLSDEESSSQWQRRDYKCFGPNEGGNVDWDSAVAIQETPVQSAITSVQKVTANRLNNSQLATVYGLEEESVVLRGYAFSGGGRRIVRVDVSPDNGKTWQQARIEGDQEQKGHRAWSWRHWDVAIPTRLLSGNICIKATDDGYNTQPETFAPYYNFRGNLANGWHRIPVKEALNTAVVHKR